MERTYTTDAIVLRTRDVREHDKQVIVYTKRFGKLELLARGTKKITSKLNAHLEPLYTVRLMGARGKRGDKLAGSLLVRAHERLRASLPGMAAAYYIGDMTDRLIAGSQQDEALYGLLERALGLLDGEQAADLDSALAIAHGYALQLLDRIGYRPEVYRCIRCYRGMLLPKNRFHILSGGIVCDRCAPISLLEPYMDISDESIAGVRLLLDADIDRASDHRLSERARQEIDTLVHRLLVTHTSFDLPSYRFLRHLASIPAVG